MASVLNSTWSIAPKENQNSRSLGIASLFVIIAIFSRELGRRDLFGIDFDWISYPFYIVYFLALVITLKLTFDKYLLFLFSFLLIGSLYAKGVLSISLLPFLKQFAPIFIIYTVVSFVIRKNNIQTLFNIYVKFAVFSAVLGLIQLFLKFAGINFLTGFSWYNIDSIAEEPSHYAAILLPAVVYTLQKFREYKKEFILLVTVLILTFNLTAYFVFGLICLIIYRKIYYFIIVLPLVLIIGNYIYHNDHMIRFRIDESIKYAIYQDITDTHGTPLSFFSNLQVAMYNANINPLSGSGLGGHEEMYYRYFKSHTFSRLDYLFGLNAKSAHSLIIRILSELGVIGLFLFLYVLLRVFRLPKTSEFYIIGLACISHFLCKSLKLGNYFDLGTPFFFLCVLYVYKLYLNEKNHN